MTYRIPRNLASLISFKNVGRDFESDYILLGKTKSGRYKLGEISGSGPEGYDVYRTRYTTIEKKGANKYRHWIKESGSAFNSYYRDE